MCEGLAPRLPYALMYTYSMHTHTHPSHHTLPPHLVTSSTSWLHFLGMMSAAVKFVILWIIEVDEINEQLFTLLTSEASRVPALVCTRTFSKHSNTADFDGHFAFFAGLRMGEREGGDGGDRRSVRKGRRGKEGGGEGREGRGEGRVKEGGRTEGERGEERGEVGGRREGGERREGRGRR